MVVAVITVLVVQTAVDDVVNVITVRYGFVAATFAVNVAVAGVNRMAAVRVGFIDTQGVFIVVAVMLMVQVAVVQIIDVASCLMAVWPQFGRRERGHDVRGFYRSFFSPNVQ